MAKIITTEIESQQISSSYSIYKIVLLGVLLGLIFTILTFIMGNFVSSAKIAGDIATIFTAVFGVIIMVNLNMIQPLIVAISSGMALWGLTLLTNGLEVRELIIWNVILYSLSYLLFSWIVRYVRTTYVIVSIVAIIILLRIIVSL